MPLLLALGLFLFVILIAIILLPLSLVQRYRVGTSRQQARGWLIALNLFGIGASAVMFLVGAAFTNIWIPNAFLYSLAGLLTGCAVGLFGLLLTRWEPTPRALHYTPSRMLVLTITLVITGRLLYGFWRAWHTWGSVADRNEWFVTAGVAESLGAGAVVLGYYFAYWLGVRWRQRKHERRRLRLY